jgi:hypothetical protein
MKLFQSYRIAPWEPEIIGVDTLEEVVQLIHSEDDVDDELVGNTEQAIELGIEDLEDSDIDVYDSESVIVTREALRAVYGHVYTGMRAGNQFRGVPMVIHNHVPPDPKILPELLIQLETQARIATVEDLEDWYWDFVTINPFTMGNNVIGGIILSAVSWFLQGNYLVEVTEGVHYD